MEVFYININNNIQDNVYGAVIMEDPLREFTRRIWRWISQKQYNEIQT